MIELNLSTCLRQLCDQFAPYCLTGVTMTPERVRDLVSLLTVYATSAERLEGTPVPKLKGQIIAMRDHEVARTVPINIIGKIS